MSGTVRMDRPDTVMTQKPRGNSQEHTSIRTQLLAMHETQCTGGYASLLPTSPSDGS
jgi:hypothetical protein